MALLKLPHAVYKRFLRAAEKEAPLEACGLLAGSGETVHKFYLIINADASPEHYSMDPAEQFAALKDMRERGWEIIGICHSHPLTPARMSAEDEKLAFMPGVSYVILSLAPVPCVDNAKACNRFDICVTRDVWSKLKDAVIKELKAKTLAELADEQRMKCESAQKGLSCQI